MIFLKIAFSAILICLAEYFLLKWGIFHKTDETEEEKKKGDEIEMIVGLSCGALVIIIFLTLFIGIWTI